MPIELACPACQKRMHVPDAAAGRRVKCPSCQSPLLVPVAAAAPAPGRPAPIERWTLLTEDQQQFGPVPRPELDQWYSEGRITPQCQLLREDAPAWQWAVEIYPALAAAGQPGVAAPPSNPFQFSDSGTSRTTPKTSATKGPRGKRSQAISYASMACAIAGIALISRALLWIMFRVVFAANLASKISARAAADVAFESTITGIVLLVVAAILSIPYFVAAAGINKRQGWGKVMGFVSGGLSSLLGLLVLLYLARNAYNYSRLTSIGFRLPAEFHTRIMMSFLLDALFAAVLIAQAVTVFAVLSNRKYANEFD
jgi:hypothetical protein